MQVVGGILQAVGGIISLVCLIMVIIKVFQHGQTGLGIALIVLSLCCIGGLITYIYGWVKSGEWNIQNVMIAWTVGIILGIVGGAMNPPNYQQIQVQHGVIPVSVRPAL
jgi:hypothetical protein